MLARVCNGVVSTLPLHLREGDQLLPRCAPGSDPCVSPQWQASTRPKCALQNGSGQAILRPSIWGVMAGNERASNRMSSSSDSSMDEILASIRRIIAEEPIGSRPNPGTVGQAPEPEAPRIRQPLPPPQRIEPTLPPHRAARSRIGPAPSLISTSHPFAHHRWQHAISLSISQRHSPPCPPRFPTKPTSTICSSPPPLPPPTAPACQTAFPPPAGSSPPRQLPPQATPTPSRLHARHSIGPLRRPRQ